jgi:putative membrane protein
MRAFTIRGFVVAVAALVPLTALAQQSTQPSQSSGSSSRSTSSAQSRASGLDRSDKAFVTKAAQDGKAEVMLGQLAAERGGSDAVKQFGQRMVSDHGKANDELAQLAQQKGVTVGDADSSHKKMHDRLAKLSGAQFDREYMREMTRDHDKDVKEFQRAAKSAKDPDVKAWAAKTLPVLQEHQQQAKQLAASAGKEGGSASPGGASGPRR